MLPQTLTAQLDKIGGVVYNAPMREYTSFKIGGPADALFWPSSAQQIRDVIALCKACDIRYTVMGNGSNLLVGDSGIRGVVIAIGENMSAVRIDGTALTAQSGVLLSKLANTAASASLTGLEFAAGIPGTLGGAVYMNAGAYGGEIKDVVVRTTCLDDDGEIKTVEGEAHQFRYRGSVFSDNGSIILESALSLSCGDKDKIRARMSELNARRRDKQPLTMPSAGSAFKRPEGYFAGTLIEQSGLKGYCVGGAQVSEKHAGFVVNAGGATAADVLALIGHIKRTVYDRFGVELECEVRMIGEI